ncbi:PAS domain S-box protein [Gramella sp. GC03-9]|uniref:histidine kinase n=1 Tax=Christiangramia oceanisediminis TaxID=2920386 RepID=A0A9X2I131_9FLAO|nr:PAS domain S-box protein [Gramella oceanisediminis]MCP9198695.1 PAS domain S-box protein [Gramella oceanisediminis]
MTTRSSNPSGIANRKPLFFGLLAGLFLLVAGLFMLWQRYQILLENRQGEMSGIVEVVGQNIEQSLKYSYSAATSLALQVDENGEIRNFDKVAPQLVDNNPNIDGIQIVPKGIITRVYPYEPNKEAINYNILKDSTRNQEALKAIDERRMFFAGPLELRQGGMAVIGRLPVFIDNEFWGFVAVLIDFDNLVDQSGIHNLAGDEYRFQFSKTDPVTGGEKFFLSEAEISDFSYSEGISLPDGDWKIHIIPVSPSRPLYILIPVGLLILVLSGSFGWIIYNALKQPALLAEKLQQQAGELAETEMRFRTIFNQAAIGMARVNTQTGEILETNKKFRELLGYSKKELHQMVHTQISHPEDIAENLELMHDLEQNRIREYSLRKRLIRKDGEVIWINLNVSALWPKGEEASTHIALVEDVSARVHAKKRLKYNEKRFRSLVENSDEIILIINAENEVLYYSPALTKVSGYENIDFVGNGVLHYIHPDDQDLLREKVETSYARPAEPITDIILRVKDSNDNWFWVNATLTNMLETEHVNGFVVNLRDITEKREAELNLVKSYELVMEQNKRLLNFAYIVSHNLRSHSSNMQSILELLDGEQDERERENYLKLLEKVSANLDQSLSDLNEVVSINTNLDIEVESIRVLEVVNQTLEMLRHQICQAGASIDIDIPEQMRVNFNPAYMESVILNFLTNALRYSDESRKLKIQLKAYPENGKWQLEFSDNGIGIDLEKHGDKLFGLYKTFSGRKDARGVGLFITKNQINAMGGGIEVKSQPGVGTTFKVSFQ